MAKLSRTDLLSRIFQDPKNYPYGFSRSGDFSISEARTLSEYGNLIMALTEGKIAPETDEDKALLALARGEKAPSTVAEKAWDKYIKRINRQRTGSIYGRRNAQSTDNDSDSTDEADEPLDSNIALEEGEG